MRAELGRHRELHQVVDRALSLRLGDGDIAKFMCTVDKAYLDTAFESEQCFHSLIQEVVVRRDIQDFVILHAPDR